MTQTANQADELRKYLDPEVLAGVRGLDLRTRLIVEGFLVGLHRSPYQGLSVEFHQHREYVPGDDTRHVDWKVYSRTDRYYIKQFEEETNLRCTFLVDVSESMKYAGAPGRGPGLTKFHYASCLAAAMAMLLVRQQDAAGLVTFDEDVVAAVPPSASPNVLKAIVHHLEQASGSLERKTSVETACRKVAEQLGRRGMVCVLSDLLVEDDEALLRGLIRLRHRGHDVLVLHVLDDDELSFPFEGNTRFVGLEDAGELIGQPRALRTAYLEAVGRYVEGIRRQCAGARISYATVNTADRLGAVLARFLAQRAAVARRAPSKRR
jgi:uncharacterized protein (DUF58 family)